MGIGMMQTDGQEAVLTAQSIMGLGTTGGLRFIPLEPS